MPQHEDVGHDQAHREPSQEYCDPPGKRGNGHGAQSANAFRAESWQLYEIDRQTDPAQIERIQHEIEATLADVRQAQSALAEAKVDALNR